MKRLALLLCGAACILLPAHSQGLTLAPILMEAPAGGGATSLTIGSTLPDPMTVQVRVYDWTQVNGQDELTPAVNVRFAPEIFELRPGQQQTVRVQVPETGGAGAWRVIVDELPELSQEENAATTLHMRLRYVLPMFAGPAGKPEQLEAEIVEGAIRLANPGPGWLKLHALRLKDEAGRVMSEKQGIMYVLAGGSAEYLLAEGAENPQAISYDISTQTFSRALREVK